MELLSLQKALSKNGFNAVMKNGKVRVTFGNVTLPVTIAKDLSNDTLNISYPQWLQVSTAMIFLVLSFISLGNASFTWAGIEFALGTYMFVSLILTEINAKELRQHIRQMSIPEH
ncbi:hypothetical protein [Enterovibrio nigricans]|uniref:Uncharacterized protein n=1 Tax=Enterovibrio nigricans DSM 22720 TaxID=1121868 RepID=A0A1T4VIW9_9GAMM|nr:hypothetical protein [Enterovibrio nigricans]PKF48791.1 hypothetical protein AT251_23575 [Enterovibrio nigricans]SKA64818.1 hypothetical protein SAMN02745132_03891 [Enterovibrio nigricans DSM 22720]